LCKKIDIAFVAVVYKTFDILHLELLKEMNS